MSISNNLLDEVVVDNKQSIAKEPPANNMINKGQFSMNNWLDQTSGVIEIVCI